MSVEEDETLGPRTDLVTLTGETGPNRKEQAGSHPHDCPFDPAGRFVVVPDKGLDQIFVFRLHAASGKLVANNPPSVATREGARPRHIAFHPSLPVAYVINELSSTMTTYNYDTARGALQAVQVLPTTPPSFTSNNTGAEVAVAPSGRFVYGSNRGHDSIVIFAVDRANGTLTPVDWVSTQGRTPRFFALDGHLSLRRQPGHRHDRHLSRQSAQRTAHPDGSDRQGRQPLQHCLCARLESLGTESWEAGEWSIRH